MAVSWYVLVQWTVGLTLDEAARGSSELVTADAMAKIYDSAWGARVLIFGVGPLGGTSISTGRTEVTAKSPATGYLGSSNFGGFFGSELKFAGYDNIVVTGKATKPVYIWICNDEVEIRDATSLWGKNTYETPPLIREELGNPEARIACIGPAGENLVRFATIDSSSSMRKVACRCSIHLWTSAVAT